MKKYLGFLIIAGFLSTGITVAQAELSTSVKGSTTATTSVKQGVVGQDGMIRDATPLDENLEIDKEVKSKVDTLRAQATTKMEGLKEKIKTEKNKVTAKIKEERLKSREQALARFDVAIERVTTFENRVNVQMDKVAELGIDTTLAQTHVNTAHTKLEEAKTKVLEIHTMLAASTDEIKGDNKTKLKTMVTDTENLLKDSYKTLNDAVKALKDSVKAQRATSELNTNVNVNVNTTTTQ
jgi:F0F1-type ATP synthase membrane subunit b/b'